MSLTAMIAVMLMGAFAIGLLFGLVIVLLIDRARPTPPESTPGHVLGSPGHP